ncbi:MAG: LysM peptidoglycan-binding domain-containing protein [Clostridia bacterium]|nr:LysM peptidoglycan-binding domain-containing protein [Clostridia bacterium]
MNNSNPILYTIRPGDTLYNLALMYGTTVQELIDTNLSLDPYNLRIGQQIYIYPRYNTSSYDYWMSINQVNLLKNMNLAWIEHILWTRLLLISIAESLGDLEATKTRLLENPKDIADIFRKYYGSDVANTIQKLLTEHLVIGADLITALKNGNQKLAQELNTKWYKNADDMANAFSSINPFYPREEIRQMLYNHLKLTTDEVSARLKKDYSADIKAYDMVQREILKMSEFFVNGIVKQFPNLF